MDLGLKGKYALVTGGTHGIGRSIALKLADEGCSVAVCSRTQERIREILKELKEKNAGCLGIQADITKASDVQKVMKKVIEQWGTVHILVNNVGGGGRWGQESVEETGEDVWQEVYDKNVLTTLRFTNAVIPYMRKQKWGRVVTITSIYAREAGARPWFSVAKTAQTALMKSLAAKHYLAKDGITFNSVAPGVLLIPDTGWQKALQEDPRGTQEFLKREIPAERFGTPEEVAGVVVFICSEAAGWVNGASIPVDGGQGRVF